VPGTHVGQPVDPRKPVAVPAPHVKHCAAFVVVEYEPGLHKEHSRTAALADELTYEPAAQSTDGNDKGTAPTFSVLAVTASEIFVTACERYV
jgi:hypothetical protein